MRPYRGKPVDKSVEWVYGWYMEHPFKGESENKSVIVQDEVPYEVIEKTVGQQVGKQDVNGIDAYFGQRLKDKNGTEYQIVWIDLMAAYWVIQVEYPYEKYTAELISKLEIIGSIHDNGETE